jgi:hypothetical protein
MKFKSTSRDEITKRILLAKTYSADAHSALISPQVRFTMAYDTARMWCEIVVRAEGRLIKATKGNHEKKIDAIIEFLGHEVEETVGRLQQARETRNRVMYDGEIGFVTGTTAEQLIQVLDELEVAVMAWLKNKHPDLLPLV